ncbi:MAG: ATP-binding protein [Tissierellales bacterium]
MNYKMKAMFKKALDKLVINKDISEEAKLIYVYRYISLVLTSFVYIIAKPYSLWLFKLGIILSLLVLSKVIAELYIKLNEKKSVIRTLVLIETIGITLLLLPTGGLASPFIWYALNPTLVASSYLPAYFCWVNMVFYMLLGSIMSIVVFNPYNKTIIEMFAENSSIFLVFALITLAVKLLYNLIKKLYSQIIALQTLNIKKQESLAHIMSLYQVMETLNNNSSKEKLFETLAVYISKLTKSDLSFFWLPNSKECGEMIKASKNLEKNYIQKILLELGKIKIEGNDPNKANEIKISNGLFLVMPIVSSSNYYGLIAIQKPKGLKADETQQNIKLLEFLAELSSVTLERFNIEDMEDHLLVLEEQNRIANEIHDSVCQRLFSISYASHGILSRWDSIPSEEFKDVLAEIKNSSTSAIQELRNCIYRLSSEKKGEDFLQVSLRTYLENVSKLHNIAIGFDYNGDEMILSLAHKKGLTRIIREACGNAIRHGKCNEINLITTINRDFIKLIITDDGKGFMINLEDDRKHKGIGISNMRSLVNSFNGNMQVNSEKNKGTEIHIMIPLEERITNTHEGGFAI